MRASRCAASSLARLRAPAALARRAQPPLPRGLGSRPSQRALPAGGWHVGARSAGTYTVQVKDRVMFAHTFQGEEFGPAQNMHGMTGVVHAAFIGDGVKAPNNTLLDIGAAFAMLSRALDPYRYQNLDEVGDFHGENSTVECVCRAVWTSIARDLCREAARSGATTGGDVQRLRIRIEETDVALAEYEAPIITDGRNVVLDMDGVLYSDAQKKVEKQIVAGLEKATQALGLEYGAAQDLYKRHGGTVLGLLKEGILRGDAAVEDFMRRAYKDVDLSSIKPDPLLRRQLEELAKSGQVRWWLATNSPRFFVARVLSALQLDPRMFHIVCPSSVNGWVNKPDPEFYKLLPQQKACLLDDAVANCKGAEASGLHAVHVEPGAEAMALVADNLGIVDRSWRLPKADYLRAKEAVDLPSLNSDVLEELRRQLDTVVFNEGATTLRVLDIGAGMLSMLRVIAIAAGPSVTKIRYVASEIDRELCVVAEDRLHSEFGAKPLNTPDTWVMEMAGRQFEVVLRDQDLFQALDEAVPEPYHLIVGCSILDLVDVPEVAKVLKRRHAGTLLYFPIHYKGVTKFEPKSDTLEPLTARYNDSLVCRGQVSHVNRLLPMLGETLAIGDSDWLMSADNPMQKPLFKQLVSFMATNALAYYPKESIGEAVDFINDPSAYSAQLPPLHVENVDFLGRVHGSAAEDDDGSARRRRAVEFSAPGEVRVVDEEMPALPEGSAAVRATLSAVSAGTESKVLAAGVEGSGEQLDETLASLASQGGWPIRYGYCMVGRVEQSSRFVPGTRVFCFHPHASLAHIAEADMIEIPDDVTDEDAAFFANMETACSLVQDGAAVLGDRTAVFGAGVVGSLTAAVLAHRRQHVTVFDPLQARLAALSSSNPRIQVASTCVGQQDFDAVIEASGAPAALSDAVGVLRRGGKLVVGSWYGEAQVSLQLGLKFHRSEVSIAASQVSRVSAPLSTRWTKERRTELVWDMLRELRPATWVPLRRVPVEDAPGVYTELAEGRPEHVTQVLLTYDSA